MAKKGRPFTYQSDEDRPVTISVRLPAELAALVKRYAAQHGDIELSLLCREGLEWRIGDGDPRGTGLYLDEPRGISDKAYSSNTEIAPGVDNSARLVDMQAALARQEEQMEALTAAIERLTTPAGNGAYDSNTEIESLEPERPAEQANVLQTAQTPALARVEIPTFDPAKHHLGTLCHHKHEWGTSGKTLRNIDNQCLKCKAEAKAVKDAAKRAKRAAQPVAG